MVRQPEQRPVDQRLVHLVADAVGDVERGVAALQTGEMLEGGARVRCGDHRVLGAVQEVIAGQRRDRLGQTRVAAREGQHASGQAGHRRAGLQRHDRALREADERGGGLADAEVALAGTDQLDEGRQRRAHPRRAVFLGHALDREPLASGQRRAGVEGLDAVGQHEGRGGKGLAQRMCQRHEILRAGADAVQQDHQLLRGLAGLGQDLDQSDVHGARLYFSP